MEDETAASKFYSQISDCVREATRTLKQDGVLGAQSLTGDGGRRVCFELEAFCVFLLSHAMLHSGHDQRSWAEVCGECVTTLEFEYGDLAEGVTLESVAESRFDAYGKVSQKAIASGNAGSQPIGWASVLARFLAAAELHPLTQSPPIVVRDLVVDARAKMVVAEVVGRLIVPNTYAKWKRLFERHKSLRGISAARLAEMMNEPARSGFFWRMISKLSGPRGGKR